MTLIIASSIESEFAFVASDTRRTAPDGASYAVVRKLFTVQPKSGDGFIVGLFGRPGVLTPLSAGAKTWNQFESLRLKDFAAERAGMSTLSHADLVSAMVSALRLLSFYPCVGDPPCAACYPVFGMTDTGDLEVQVVQLKVGAGGVQRVEADAVARPVLGIEAFGASRACHGPSAFPALRGNATRMPDAEDARDALMAVREKIASSEDKELVSPSRDETEVIAFSHDADAWKPRRIGEATGLGPEWK